MTLDSSPSNAARVALLQGLTALDSHRDSLILVGAQAIYRHTSHITLPVAPFTEDADFVFDTESLGVDPSIDEALRQAGFSPNTLEGSIGSWINQAGVPLDLMVPNSQGSRGRRSARLPGHGEHSIRKTPGLEAVIFDNSKFEIEAVSSELAPVEISVAGPTSLLVAKLIKFGERVNTPRFVQKDAYDIYRLLFSISTSTFVSKWQEFQSIDVVQSELKLAFDHLNSHFASSANSAGAIAAGMAEKVVGEPSVVSNRTWALSQELLTEIRKLA